MELSKFLSEMGKYGIAYITYDLEKPVNGRKNTFVVATVDFNSSNIARIEAENTKVYGSPHPDVEEGQVLVFSYSKNKFRTLPLASIKRVDSLASEMMKATPLRGRSR